MKGNQKFLLASCERTAANEQPADTSTSCVQGHGRREQRTVQVFASLASFGASVRKQWGKYIKAVLKVTRVRKEFSTKAKRWQTSREEAYYITTTRLSARAYGTAIREHWWIENKNHYVRDVSMGEDCSRIRVNSDRFVRMRSFALNVMRVNGEQNIKRARYENALRLENVLNYKQLW